MFYMQQPNYYGIIEDSDKISEIVHEKGASFIMGCNPISLGILKTLGSVVQILQWEKDSHLECPCLLEDLILDLWHQLLK